MTGTLHTYGIFLLKILAFTGRQDKELGWVYDFKWAFSNYAREERKFEVEHMRLLQSAAKAGGLKLECTPMLEGTALEPAMIPAMLRGNITIIDGEVVITTRVFRHELEERGIGVEMILSASNCLECTADEQQTLEESIQSELESNREEDAQLAGTQTLEEAVVDAIQSGADSLPADTELFINGKKVKKSQGSTGAQA